MWARARVLLNAGAVLRRDSRMKIRALATALVCLMVMGVRSAAAATTRVVDDDGMGSVADCNDSTPAFLSISAAVIASSSGDTIKVCPGTYVENVVLNKSLTLLGAQSGVDARGRIATESIVTPLVATVRTLELQAGSAGSIIDGFTFLGGSRAIESTTGPINDIQTLNNRIQGFTGSGLFLNDNGINITIDKNDIDGTAKVGSGDLVHLDTDNFDGLWFTNNHVFNGLTATGFFVDGTRNVDKSTPGARRPEFTGNLIDRNQTGVNLGRLAWGDGPISGNTFSNNLFDGLQGGPKNSTIEKNSFASNGRNGLALTSFGNTTDPARGAQNNSITQNCFTGNGFFQAGAGISFSATQFPGTISTNKANQNNIVGNNIGVQYLGAETINAEQNWWGSPTGPTHVNNPGGTGDKVVDDGNGVDYDPWRTTGVGNTPCSGGPATTLTLTPTTATNQVDTQHCVTATVTNAIGVPQPGVTVRFSVTGAVNTSGSATTDVNGQATFCYMGPALPGADVIRAFADFNPNNGMEDAGEPFDVATKIWILPVTTPGCEITITNGGWIIANNGDRANFGGNAKADEDSNVSGQEEYQDQGPADPFNLHGTPTVIVCDASDPTHATIFGDATIDGSGSHPFRIDVRDVAEPGKGVDTYRMQVDTYDSGEHTLEGGNVQIHRQ
jgi:hypothetical protein